MPENLKIKMKWKSMQNNPIDVKNQNNLISSNLIPSYGPFHKGNFRLRQFPQCSSKDLLKKKSYTK